MHTGSLVLRYSSFCDLGSLSQTTQSLTHAFTSLRCVYATYDNRRPKLADTRTRILVSREEQAKTLQRIRRAEAYKRKLLECSIEAKDQLADEIKASRARNSKAVVLARLRYRAPLRAWFWVRLLFCRGLCFKGKEGWNTIV